EAAAKPTAAASVPPAAGRGTLRQAARPLARSLLAGHGRAGGAYLGQDGRVRGTLQACMALRLQKFDLFGRARLVGFSQLWMMWQRRSTTWGKASVSSASGTLPQGESGNSWSMRSLKPISPSRPTASSWAPNSTLTLR